MNTQFSQHTHLPKHPSHARYRAALMGKSLADTSSSPDVRSSMLNRCVDMLQFLLEALPEEINEMHIIFLYARTLEQSSDPAVRFRAGSAYESLFNYCKEHKIANAEQFDAFKSWSDESLSWQKLAVEVAAADEVLLAKEGYESFIYRVNLKRGPGKDLSHYIDTKMFLEIAFVF